MKIMRKLILLIVLLIAVPVIASTYTVGVEDGVLSVETNESFHTVVINGVEYIPLVDAITETECPIGLATDGDLPQAERARVNVTDDGLKLRNSNSINSDVLATMPDGSVVEVIAGPLEGDNYIWWNVRYGELVGWAVERADEIDTLQRICN